jgi:putative transposase
VLVLIGATEDGRKELLAVVDVIAKAPNFWRELLGQLKSLGLSRRPSWPLVTDHWASGLLCRKNTVPIAQQRCWVHKTVNILDKMPKSVQGKAKQLIHEM